MLAACLVAATAVPSLPSSFVNETTEGNPDRVVYVIASEERFWDGRVQQLRDVLGYTFIRAEPVFTKSSDCPLAPEADTTLRGIFIAHRNVWAAIALSNSHQRMMVLESDFSFGNRSVEELQNKVNAAFEREEDFTSVGWCNMCETTEAPCWSCATAYIMHPHLARILIKNDFCMAADTILVGVCPDEDGSTKSGWAPSFRATLGLDEPVRCSWLDEPPMFADLGDATGDFHLEFRGLFQQNTTFASSHNGATDGDSEQEEPQINHRRMLDMPALRPTRKPTAPLIPNTLA
jgi:hypothetical protein